MPDDARLDDGPPPDAPDPRGRTRRALAIVALSALGHVGLLALLATGTAPPPPPAQRQVEVMSFEVVHDRAGAADEWRNEGGRRAARIRPDPAGYAR